MAQSQTDSMLNFNLERKFQVQKEISEFISELKQAEHISTYQQLAGFLEEKAKIIRKKGLAKRFYANLH